MSKQVDAEHGRPDMRHTCSNCNGVRPETCAYNGEAYGVTGTHAGLSDEECDKAAAQAMDRIAAAKGMHALDLNPDITAHWTLRRELIRAGYALARGVAPSDGGERARFEAAMRVKHPEWAFTADPVFDYHNERTRCAWEGWQAALAAGVLGTPLAADSDPEKRPDFYTWTWDVEIGGGRWEARYGWKKPVGAVHNLKPLFTHGAGGKSNG